MIVYYNLCDNLFILPKFSAKVFLDKSDKSAQKISHSFQLFDITFQLRRHLVIKSSILVTIFETYDVSPEPAGWVGKHTTSTCDLPSLGLLPTLQLHYLQNGSWQRDMHCLWGCTWPQLPLFCYSGPSDPTSLLDSC